MTCRLPWIAIATLSVCFAPAPFRIEPVEAAAARQEDAALRREAANLQARLQEARTVTAYTDVRLDARRLQARAEGLGFMDLAFNAAVISADAAYFRASADDVAAAEREHPLAALEDLLVAFPLRRHATERAWVEQLVTLTAATVSTATTRIFGDNDRIHAALKPLAALVDELVPADFIPGEQVVGNLRRAIDIARILARLSYRYGNAALAESRLTIAEARANELGDVDLVLTVISARYIGERSVRAGPAELRRLRDDAWQRAQDLRNEYRSATGRIWAGDRSDTLFDEMLRDELAVGGADADTVFARVESLRARMLLDRLSLPGRVELRTPQALALESAVLSFSQPPQPDTTMTAAEMRLLSRLSGFETTRSPEDARARASSLRRLEDLYRGAGAGYRETASTVALRTLQATLAPDEAMIEYVIPDPLSPKFDLWILLITRDSVEKVEVGFATPPPGAGIAGRFTLDGGEPLDASALAHLIAATRTAIRSADDRGARQQLTALHAVLIAPLEVRGFRPESFKRIVIVPHGALHYVPFAALLDRSGTFLIAKTEVVIAPSASVWRLLRLREREAGPLVVLANPELGSRGVRALPFADQEGTAIVAARADAGARLFRAGDATRRNLFAAASGAGILHLATHGDFPDQNAANAHALWLADEAGQSVALTAADVRTLPLAAARLVVLSVCNGGLYRTGPSDEPYGLLPAFLEAGSPNVVGTLWPLDDQFGRDFMIEFYQHLPTLGVAGALRKASLRFIGEDEYLRNWAAFVLVGSGRLE